MTPTLMSQADARRYRTARFSQQAHGHQHGLPTGPVRIAFFCHALNAFTWHHECIFACYLNDDDASLIGTYFQNALIEFQE